MFRSTKIYQDNLATDTTISNITLPSTDPFNMANSESSTILAQVNTLEQVNLLIDNVALGYLSISVLEHTPTVELLPPGVDHAADFGIEYFEAQRDKINIQIDQLLQSISPKP